MVAVLNTVGFRLADAPFHLGLGAASLVFLVYPLGSLSSVVSGRLADRLRPARRAAGRLRRRRRGRAAHPARLAARWSCSALGAAHRSASSPSTASRAAGSRPAPTPAASSTGQAASLYLFTYYVGSSVFGSLAGSAYDVTGWSGVVVLAVTLLLISAGCAHALRRTPALPC